MKFLSPDYLARTATTEELLATRQIWWPLQSEASIASCQDRRRDDGLTCPRFGKPPEIELDECDFIADGCLHHLAPEQCYWDWSAPALTSVVAPPQYHTFTVANSTSAGARLEGLMSLELRADNVLVHQLQTAPWNDPELTPLLGIQQNWGGVGTLLVLEAVKFSKQHGRDGKLELTSRELSRDFYVRRGFTRVGHSGSLYRLSATAAEKLLAGN